MFTILNQLGVGNTKDLSQKSNYQMIFLLGVAIVMVH